MGLKSDLTEAVDGILGTAFRQREGRTIPTSADVALADGAVKLDAAFIYADLAGSGRIATVCPWDTTAKIIRAYLDCAVRIIRAHGGEIRSFDGDRVMGVFIGDLKRSNAVRSALKIKWATENLIQEKATRRFKSVRESGVRIRQACGVDVGTTRAVRAGIRSNNDLIWIGRPPSFAAKLSDLRQHPYSTFISKAVHGSLAADAKVNDGGSIWEKRAMPFAGVEETIYRSRFWLEPA